MTRHLWQKCAYMASALLLDCSLEDSLTFACGYQAVHILAEGLLACHNVNAPLHYVPTHHVCTLTLTSPPT